jgi:hypothetical protein
LRPPTGPLPGPSGLRKGRLQAGVLGRGGLLVGSLTSDTPTILLALKWAVWAIRGGDYEWAEREVKQAIRMMEGEQGPCRDGKPHLVPGMPLSNMAADTCIHCGAEHVDLGTD